MSQDQVLVPPEVYDGLESLYEAGELDPDDREAAARTASERGDEYVTEWLENVGDQVYERAATGAFTTQTEDSDRGN